MSQITFQISDEIFQAAPGYRRAIIVATGINNSAPVTQLAGEIKALAENIRQTVANDDPRIVAWREAFKNGGIKPRDFRPSIDALVRRILNDKPLGSISPIVDIGTIISLKYILPAGAHPLLTDSMNIILKRAAGELTVLEDDVMTTVPAGEIVLVDTNHVATRRWVWRQTEYSRIDNSTTDFYLNIDALNCIDDQTLEHAITTAQTLLTDIFNIESKVVVLSQTQPTIRIDL